MWYATKQSTIYLGAVGLDGLDRVSGIIYRGQASWLPNFTNVLIRGFAFIAAALLIGAAPFSARTRHARGKPVVSVILRGRRFKPVVGVAPVTATCSIRTLSPCLNGVSIQNSPPYTNAVCMQHRQRT